jgi:hypothetical protein
MDETTPYVLLAQKRKLSITIFMQLAFVVAMNKMQLS